jgi:hypothetical protein
VYGSGMGSGRGAGRKKYVCRHGCGAVSAAATDDVSSGRGGRRWICMARVVFHARRGRRGAADLSFWGCVLARPGEAAAAAAAAAAATAARAGEPGALQWAAPGVRRGPRPEARGRRAPLGRRTRGAGPADCGRVWGRSRNSAAARSCQTVVRCPRRCGTPRGVFFSCFF